MRIKLLRPEIKVPEYATHGSAGFDIYLPEDVILHKEQVTLVPLGFATEIPEGHVALMFPRSGLGTKKGVVLANTVGVIDADYRGEWHAPLTLGDHSEAIMRTINKGERVCQAVILPVTQVRFQVVDELNDTDRGEGGFGSTGTE